MNEFAKKIYEYWANATDENEGGNGITIDWGNYNEEIEKIHNFLAEPLANELEYNINRNAWKIQENSFIAGFFYAFKCISRGRVELKGGGLNE